ANATFRWLECADVCIPKEQKIELTQLNNKTPWLAPPPLNISIKTIKKRTSIEFIFPRNVNRATFFPYQNKQFDLNKSTLRNNILSIKLVDKSIQTISGELFLDFAPPIIINQELEIIPSPYYSIFITLLSAFLGGLLLNIMPCVLPIIGLKAMHLKTNPSQNRPRDAIYYWLGIAISLLTLFAILMGLKQFGAAIGWGFQLQSPIIIESLVVLFILIMAINLDMLRLPLPSFISRKSNHMLMNGILTTIIATPCTAPFLGSALAIALFQHPTIGLAIFLSISLGLALPMTLLILKPKWHVWLPKSNRWNYQFKFYLNFGFVLTIGWLMWVLGSQIAITEWIAFLSCVILLFILLLSKSKQSKKKPLILLFTIIAICTIPLLIKPNSKTTWIPYATETIQTLEATKTPYLIDVTAKWCITCQTNKITVLNQAKTLKFLKSKNITLIQADWTNNDTEISNLLASYQQVSIPTYIYYNGNRHIVFGDILTFNKLKEKIK
ncbi:MAG: thioredoxin family protein, partial [Candidatus Margulisiibacteriota bacterium]